MNDQTLIHTIEQLIGDDPLNEYRLLRLLGMILESDEATFDLWRLQCEECIRENGRLDLEQAVLLMGTLFYRRPGPDTSDVGEMSV